MPPEISLTALAKGLANNELVFYFQPIISLFNGHICGAESLIRWIQPDGGIISPASFIPLAEETGFITELTQEMLPKVIRDLDVINRHSPEIFVSFNVSPQDLESRDFAQMFHKATQGKLHKPGNLFIEVTENAFLPDNFTVMKTMQDLAEQGIKIHLDDFSAGHTTLSQLTKLPISAIKIALPIVQNAALSRRDFRLFRHLISMGHQLGLDIIAEGIEDLETHTLVTSSGCTHSQGYYFARPMPLEELLKIIHNEPSWADYPFGLAYLAQIDHIDFRRDVIRASLMIHRNHDETIRSRALNRLPELDPVNCLFGRWYEQVRQYNHKTPSFNLIEIEHKIFHTIANDLIQSALAGEHRDKLESKIDSFSKQSKKILSLVQDIEIERLKENFLHDNSNDIELKL